MNEFSVCQFFANGRYEYVRRFVSPEEAAKAFWDYTTSVGALIGTTVRVIITDGGDMTNMEWEFGRGIIFPANEVANKGVLKMPSKKPIELPPGPWRVSQSIGGKTYMYDANDKVIIVPNVKSTGKTKDELTAIYKAIVYAINKVAQEQADHEAAWEKAGFYKK